MAPEAHRSARLARAFGVLRTAAEGELGRAMAGRAATVAEIDRLAAALAAETRFADLVLAPTLTRMTALTARLDSQDAEISRLRQRRAHLSLSEKRLAASAEARQQEADRRKERKDLVALTDAAAGRRAASLPQGGEA